MSKATRVRRAAEKKRMLGSKESVAMDTTAGQGETKPQDTGWTGTSNQETNVIARGPFGIRGRS